MYEYSENIFFFFVTLSQKRQNHWILLYGFQCVKYWTLFFHTVQCNKVSFRNNTKPLLVRGNYFSYTEFNAGSKSMRNFYFPVSKSVSFDSCTVDEFTQRRRSDVKSMIQICLKKFLFSLRRNGGKSYGERWRKISTTSLTID